MKLFKISRPNDASPGETPYDDTPYDDYEGAIVAAPDEDSARNMQPGPERNHSDWIEPHEVVVTYIGEAISGIEQGVILASYKG